MPHIPICATKPQKAALRKASSAAVEKTFQRLTPYFPHRRWLPNGNRYRDHCIARLDKDHAGGGIRGSDLAKYISASAIPHALDAWSFFGRAISAHLRGDSVSCRHLAYYGELRAAISLLATQGVGVFNYRHYVIEASGHVSEIPKRDGTHILTWKALAHWSQLRRSSRLLERIITPGGLAIADWQSGMFSQDSFRAIGTLWLQRWGLDIQQCADDQNLRNESSYRPSHLRNTSVSYTAARAGIVKEFWELCEPSGAELFQRLDRHLLRMWIREQYIGVKGLPANETNPDYIKEVSELVDRVNPQGLTKSLWIEFLCHGAKHPDSSLMAMTDLGPASTASTQHIEMLARALMLLRLATGACRQLLINSGVEKSHLHFWWHSLGAEMAFWNDADEPNDPQTLWLDIELAIKEVDQWLTTGDEKLMRTFRANQASALGVIDEVERVAFWGMGL